MQARAPIDTDNDGKIRAEEAQAQSKRIFSALDADGDGQLSPQETAGLTAIEPGYVVVTRMIPVVMTADVGGRMWSQMDQNQDRQISRQEYMQYGEQQFKKAQEQAGGKLTAAGAQTAMQQSGAQSGSGEENVVRWREASCARES